MTKPWIGYVRLSTQEQADTNALRNQIDRLKAAGAEDVFHDIESGSDTERENLTQVLKLVVSKDVAGVIATRWDRLTRNYGLYLHIKEIIRESGVQLRLLDQGTVDLQTASGELYADMQAIFAVHELRQLKERVRNGFQKRRDRNAAWSRSPWGYWSINEEYQPDYSPLTWCALIHRPDNYQELYNEPDDSSLLIKISKAQIAREIFSVVLETRSPAKTLKYLREEYNLQRASDFIPVEMQTFPITERGFKDWLLNPVLCGHTAYLKQESNNKRLRKSPEDWDVRYDTHKGIVSPEEAQELQDILSTNRNKKAPLEKTSYLTGLVYCSQCNQKCTLKTGDKYRYYGCRHASTTCGNRGSVRIEQIDKAVIQAITEKAWEIAKFGSNTKSDILIQLEDQYQKLFSDTNLDSFPSLVRAKEELQQKINEEANRVDEIAKQMLMNPQAQQLNFWYTLTQNERRIFYEKLVHQILIKNNEVTSVILMV